MARTELLTPVGHDNIVRDEILYLPLNAIDPDPEQPRLDVDDELADSIKQHGVLQAIQVRPHPRDGDRWMIVDGERRYRGSLRAKHDTIPSTIALDVEEPGDRIIRQLVRNEGKPLTPVEEALAFKKIIETKRVGDSKYGIMHLARDVGLPKSTISDRLTLTEIPNFWLELIVQGPLQTSHAPILHRWRKVPEKYHRIALEQMRKDYRWPGVQPGHKAKGGDRLYVGDFETLVRQYFPKFAKPVSDVPGYTGPTESLALDSYTGRKVYAMDPSLWGPIWRKGIAARRAKDAKKNKSAGGGRSSDTDWRVEQEKARAKQEAEFKAWREAWPGIIDRLVTAINAGTIDDALTQMLLDQFHDSYRSKEYKAAVARVPLGTTATELVRVLAFRNIVGSIEHPYQGSRDWPKIEKRLGLRAQGEHAPTPAKRGKKARAVAPETVAPFDDAGGVLVDVGEYAQPAPAADYEIVEA